MKQIESKTAELEPFSAGIALGQMTAYRIVASRCSAAQAATIRDIRDNKLYKAVHCTWDEFCTRYLRMTRITAERIISVLSQLGPEYFDLSNITHISPETFRLIVPHISGGAIRHNGAAVELRPENAEQIARIISAVRKEVLQARENSRLGAKSVMVERRILDNIAELEAFAAGYAPDTARWQILMAMVKRIENALEKIRRSHPPDAPRTPHPDLHHRLS